MPVLQQRDPSCELCFAEFCQARVAVKASNQIKWETGWVVRGVHKLSLGSKPKQNMYYGMRSEKR